MGIRNGEMDEEILKRHALKLDFSDLTTRFLNQDAMISMVHFRKGILDGKDADTIRINREITPVLHRYYLSGTWGMY